MRALRAALAFLTTFPIGTTDLTGEDFAQASRWFGVVGLVVGVVLALAALLLRALWPAEIGAALLLALWVGLTGGLHLDGLVDCGDALPATVSTERRLTILKDVHVGAFGVVTAVVVLLLKWSGLVTLLARPEALAGLLAAPVVGRATMMLAQGLWPYARAEGLGRLVPPAPGARLQAMLPLLVAVLLGGWRGLGSVLGALGIAWLIAAWMARRLGGGLTGDCYGALCELSETALLLCWCIEGGRG